MDIRSARRPEQGIKKPAAVTEEPIVNTTQTVNEVAGVSMEEAIKKYGDVSIASYMKDLEDNGITENDIHELLDTLVSTGNAAYET